MRKFDLSKVFASLLGPTALLVISVALTSCKEVPQTETAAETALMDADPDSVSDYEAGEVLVFSTAMVFKKSDGSIPSDVVHGESDIGSPELETGGRLLELVHLCSNGRPVWMRSHLHASRIVIVPNADNLSSHVPDGAFIDDDASLIQCVKQRYNGSFTVGLAESGHLPWQVSQEPFRKFFGDVSRAKP